MGNPCRIRRLPALGSGFNRMVTIPANNVMKQRYGRFPEGKPLSAISS